MKFARGQIVKEDGQVSNLGIILSSGDRTYDIVWMGGSTSRYRYSTGRNVALATSFDLEGQELVLKHLHREAAAAREERRTGARIKRGQVWPSR